MGTSSNKEFLNSISKVASVQDRLLIQFDYLWKNSAHMVQNSLETFNPQRVCLVIGDKSGPRRGPARGRGKSLPEVRAKTLGLSEDYGFLNIGAGSAYWVHIQPFTEQEIARASHSLLERSSRLKALVEHRFVQVGLALGGQVGNVQDGLDGIVGCEVRVS